MNSVSLQDLLVKWADYPLGKKRAMGGRNALDGFGFQIYLTLKVFFQSVVKGDTDAQFVFDGLSDLATASGDNNVYLLTQAKTTLDNSAIKDAIKEAIAVDEFLEAEYPQLREKFSFRIIGRKEKSLTKGNPAELEAGWIGADPSRWENLKKRFLPYEISGSPRVALAIQLWPHTRNSFALVDECAGQLLIGMGANKPSLQIAESLLEIWNRQRTEHSPPGRMLGLADFSLSQPSDKIVHGVVPRPFDMVEGCFMEWPERLEPVLQKIEDTIANSGKPQRRKTVPVFWLVGSSGVGKSVLLLQAIRELMLRGHVEGVHYLGSYASSLPAGLRHAIHSDEQTVIALDDIYAPGNRDGDWLQESLEAIFSANWSRPPWIVTCGPKEQLKAFKRKTSEPEIQVVEIAIPNLSRTEQSAYHAWYQDRTASSVPMVNDSILMAAAWTYELLRRENLTPQAFAERLDQRLVELDLQLPARAALALNQFQFEAPSALFSGREAALDQLRSEDVYRVGAGAASRQGRFFHAAICRVLYDCWVESGASRERAVDLARGFGSMIDEGDESAAKFLSWLPGDKSGDALPTPVFMETLSALWPELEKRCPREDTVPLLFRWSEMLQKNDVPVELGAIRQIRKWLDETSATAITWGLLYQTVWDLQQSAREDLFQLGMGWLRTSTEAVPWNFVWQRLWGHRTGDADLIEVGLNWLRDHPAAVGWGRVWQKLLTQKALYGVLLAPTLEAIPLQPESTFDLPMWTLAEKHLIPDQTALLGAVLRKLVQVRSPYKQRQGIDFILSRAPISGTLVGFLRDGQDSVGWTHVWRRLVEEKFEPEAMILIGKEWLKGPSGRNGYSRVRKILSGK